MINLITETVKVDLYDVIVAVMNVLLCLKNCLVRIPVWTESITVFGEFNLEHRTDDLVNCLLSQTIYNGRNTK